MKKCKCGRIASIKSIDDKYFCQLCARTLDMLYFNWRDDAPDLNSRSSEEDSLNKDLVLEE